MAKEPGPQNNRHASDDESELSQAAATISKPKTASRKRSDVVATFEPVHTESTAGMIATQIREALMAGALGPGSQLAESELAIRLKVSRGPVREALQRLVQEGILTEVRNRGVFVPKFDAGDVADIYLARQAIESAAVTTLIENNVTETQALERVLRRMNTAVKGTRWSTVASLDAQFHQQLVKATSSPRLVRMLDTLILESRICILALEDVYQATEDLVEEHNHIFDAIQRRDKALALQLITEHMKDAARRLGVLLEAQGDVLNNS
ncbi:MAG: GntR family transcriptional regulator [Ferrimicrobium sp.]|uniref:GntR family transcriptional regulator n=1 Tax=Ferrimicrobium acidiphilum TaxID=121039 RepID=A0ABV3Y0K5_9ACTN|nr:GntR family transcriptional regulator [Ferrimicrobium sp.]